ncbi:hypothetical protein B296_00052434 [Ensete ventricosum]|uniref:NAC domain-containing protein n=1 Tax=Ensete ventricosum TaxID=4639 RepID=A0A426XA74_ENSVE|nr:hypothetical protein B296_00052434 [Ensete ventricosum]
MPFWNWNREGEVGAVGSQVHVGVRWPRSGGLHPKPPRCRVFRQPAGPAGIEREASFGSWPLLAFGSIWPRGIEIPRNDARGPRPKWTGSGIKNGGRAREREREGDQDKLSMRLVVSHSTIWYVLRSHISSLVLFPLLVGLHFACSVLHFWEVVRSHSFVPSLIFIFPVFCFEGAIMVDVSALNMDDDRMNLPPGFRFHPTDEEIITHYLSRKVVDRGFSARAMGEVDLNKCEPWDLPSKARMGEKEWYFFCQRDRKYPTGMRTNRATEAGYWKATGKDKEIYRGRRALVGMKKTLVFYRGRAPRGQKTNWVMHEFRLEGRFPFSGVPKSAKWVVCRVFHKNMGIPRSPPPPGSERIDSFGKDLFDSTSLPPLMDPPYLDCEARPSSCFIGKEEGFDFRDIPSFSAMMGMEDQVSSNPPQSSVFYSQVLAQSPYRSFPGHLHRQETVMRALAADHDASSAITSHCKMEQCWNNSMGCASQDAGLSTDRNTDISSSMVSNHFGDLDNSSCGLNLDNIWKY